MVMATATISDTLITAIFQRMYAGGNVFSSFIATTSTSTGTGAGIEQAKSGCRISET